MGPFRDGKRYYYKNCNSVAYKPENKTPKNALIRDLEIFIFVAKIFLTVNISYG